MFWNYNFHLLLYTRDKNGTFKHYYSCNNTTLQQKRCLYGSYTSYSYKQYICRSNDFLLYSIAGGIFSFAVMSLFSLFLKKDKLWVISAFGAIGHNLGQIIVAIILTGTWRIVFYFPLLFISGIVSGIFTGIVAQLLIKKLEVKYKHN